MEIKDIAKLIEIIDEDIDREDVSFELDIQKANKYISIIDDGWIKKLKENYKQKADELTKLVKKLDDLEEYYKSWLHSFVVENMMSTGDECYEFTNSYGEKRYIYADMNYTSQVIEDAIDKTEVGKYTVELTAEEYIVLKTAFTTLFEKLESLNKVKYTCGVKEAGEKFPEAVMRIEKPTVKILRRKRKQ